MITKNLSKMILIPLAVLLAACGSIPTALSLPQEQSQVGNAPVVEDLSAPAGEDVQEFAETSSAQAGLSYPIVDTDQSDCYDDRSSITCPGEGQAFYGQDAQYTGNAPRYQDNGNDTVTDLVTGLMWQQDPGEKMTYDQAAAGVSSFNLAGYTDWRLPTIKELYSLIQFDGLDPSGPNDATLIPFIDTEAFDFEYGDESTGDRLIDSQWATSSIYTGSVMNGQQAMFGVNFADGRIKGYGTGGHPGREAKTFFVIYVRGNTGYGLNNFIDNGNGTVTDDATGLTWTQNDSGSGMDWEAALNYCESLDYAGSSEWRLPNVKELHSLVDYSRSPDATGSAAIDPIFTISTITNEAGQLDYPYFWSSTTHANGRGGGGGAYISFGRALGYMNNQYLDVHGAGAQRSDPKTVSDAANRPLGFGPQGDIARGSNYVRCVSDGTDGNVQVGGPVDNMPAAQAQAPGAEGPPMQQGAAPDGGAGPGQGQGPEGQGGGRPPIDLASAAAQLGVSEQALRAALGEPGSGPPDFAAAAAQLGVSEQALIAALGLPFGGGSPPPGGGRPPEPQL